MAIEIVKDDPLAPDPAIAEPEEVDPLDAPENQGPVDPNIKLGARSFVLVAPQSFAERSDLRIAAGQNWRRGCAAALVSCLPEKNRNALGCSLEGAGFNVLKYGGECLDALIGAKVTIDQILAAGLTALRLCRDVDQGEVQGLVKN